MQLAANWRAVMALFSDGTAWCWGDGRNGECATTPNPYGTPVRTRVACATQVSLGGDGGILRRFDGQVAVWSENGYGELGNGGAPTPPVGVPQLVPGLSDIAFVSAGGSSEFVITPEHQMLWWGRLSEPLDVAQLIPGPMKGLGPVRQVESQRHYCALGVDGHVSCWGDNVYGQLGDGGTTSRADAVEVPMLEDVAQISVGFQFTCALTTAGAVLCWGLDDAGQLGHGGMKSTNPQAPKAFQVSPTLVVGLPQVESISAGYAVSCAVSLDHQTYCWGVNFFMDGSPPWPFGVPTAVPALAGVKQVVVANGDVCALKLDHTVWCGGENTASGLGRSGFGQVMFEYGPPP